MGVVFNYVSSIGKLFFSQYQDEKLCVSLGYKVAQHLVSLKLSATHRILQTNLESFAYCDLNMITIANH